MIVEIVTPIGPGHEDFVLDCKASALRAFSFDRGLFDVMLHNPIDDTRGEMGRSKARNMVMDAGVDADWFLFLDADDLLCRDAFYQFERAMHDQPSLVAVFGAVCTDRNGVISENKYPLDWNGLLKHGAFGTLSMGCFVRADVALETPFNESMDAAEDFEFYLRLLKDRSWVKIKKPLVTIRTSVPSAVGPRGYTSLDWRGACQTVVERWK